MNPENPEYEKTIVDTIIDFLRNSQLNVYFKDFYYGDPFDIPTSAMPCICVVLDQTDIITGPTGMDKITQSITLKLIYNKKTDFGKSSTEVVGTRKLEEFAQGMNPANDQYNNKTVAGILRTNYTLGQIATNQQMRIRYHERSRPNDILTGECHITFIVEELKIVDGRS